MDKVIKILNEKVYLYGSLTDESYDEDSDIDLGVKDISSRRSFELMMEPDHLVDLDKDDDFSEFLKEEGELVRAS